MYSVWVRGFYSNLKSTIDCGVVSFMKEPLFSDLCYAIDVVSYALHGKGKKDDFVAVHVHNNQIICKGIDLWSRLDLHSSVLSKSKSKHFYANLL